MLTLILLALMTCPQGNQVDNTMTMVELGYTDKLDVLAFVLLRLCAWRVCCTAKAILKRGGNLTYEMLDRKNTRAIKESLSAVAIAYDAQWKHLADYLYEQAMSWPSEPAEYFAIRVARQAIEILKKAQTARRPHDDAATANARITN